MNYTEVRPLLGTGDIIGVKNSKSFTGKLTQFFTRSEYTHVGVVLRVNHGVWMAELNSGRNHLIPLSQLMDMPFDVFEAPVENRGYLKTSILRWLRYPVTYSFKAFLAVGFMTYFKVKYFVKVKDFLVCSGYVIKILQTAGWNAEASCLQSLGEFLATLKLKYKVNP